MAQSNDVIRTARPVAVGSKNPVKGAAVRAGVAREFMDADSGFAIEGGVVEMPDGTMRTCAWAAVVARNGRHGVGGSRMVSP